jgi:hypothetical protein
MRHLALLALLLPTAALAGSKVIRTDAYKKAKAMPPDLGIVLVGDATYVIKNRKSERLAVGAEFCPHLVRYFKSTDTFGLVRCVVVPGGNVGTERALEAGKVTLDIELPADGSSFGIDRREPAVVLFVQDLEILNTMERDELRALDDAGASSFKKPITLFASFAWWDNQQGALMGYQGMDAATTRVLYDGADPQWDDLAWYLARQLGAGMPFEFTW